MGCAFSMKEQTSQQALNVLIQGYELPPAVKGQFNELLFIQFDLDDYLSTALRCIGLSISALVLPVLMRCIGYLGYPFEKMLHGGRSHVCWLLMISADRNASLSHQLLARSQLKRSLSQAWGMI
jgi:hypothetical protein